jgi:Ulp1 family protease
VPKIPRQENGTDCGICTLMYQWTLSQLYGEGAGHAFTEDRVQALIRALQHTDRLEEEEEDNGG